MSDADVKQHVETLAAFPATLRRQLAALDDDALRFRPAPTEWSVIEIVGHYGDVEALWQGRLRQMLAADHPHFPPFDPDAIVRERDYQHKQLAALLATFAERRAGQVEFARGLRPPQLARLGRHPVRGDLTVADALAVLVWHDQNHLSQIAANLAAKRDA